MYFSLLPALIVGCGLIVAGGAAAQTFTTLHSFSSAGNIWPSPNSDGVNPQGGLILSGNTLYGTANRGGSSANGTVFAVNTDGTGFTNLHSFSTRACTECANSDGAWPSAGLILSGNTLYGTATAGGSYSRGTVYAVNTDGTGFRVLHSFIGSDGTSPWAGLTLSGTTLYGTTRFGGGNMDHGTVFAVNTNGSAFTTLHRFTDGVGNPVFTNSDGGLPGAGRLILSGNVLYGTADFGGSSASGTVFKVNTNGALFITLHSFTDAPFPAYTNSDGHGGFSGLILWGDTLYGTASGGGSSGNGTIFSMKADGTAFTTLHSFTASNTNLSGAYTNSDGLNPNGLILSSDTLYGTASGGGSSGRGTIFAVKTNGADFTTLYSFAAWNTNASRAYTNSDGAGPNGLILSGNTLYGIANSGGRSGSGTVFSLSLPGPALAFAASGNGLTLSWPTNAPFTLQSAPLVTGVYTNVPGATSPYTNAMTGPQRYFRLQGN